MTSAFSTRRLMAAAATSTATAAFLAALALPALAQTPPPAPAAATKAAEAPARKPGGPDMQKRHEEHLAHMAKRQAALKEKLKLTAGQESAWTTFTTAMQPGERPARPDPKELDKLTTPERIDRMRELRAQHTAQAERRDEAVKKFYTALTPEQQKTFDTEARHAGPGMRHGGPGHDKRGGPDGHHGRPGPRGEGSAR
ncbi:MAG: Spy/CpxP family protein refolding chaperone [Acidovorax sp.]|uniref:Spy/CpxP family protein refolding chaperone n=1 Tax=Acidovorax sp. 106 TaxID=2135637 RepID=UPI000F11EE7A|nr:Spy/CpxP family protein refolding chaperone [Acidovorax sp. 106]MCZ8092747.1 Spy/CpxP family protein refolding chaperone [Acidovorax sp.]RLJ37837.1 LTXXQ motif family protein [Acidovorax sp. 106]